MIIWDKDKEDAPFVPVPDVRHLSISNPANNECDINSDKRTLPISPAEIDISQVTVNHPPAFDRKGVPTRINPVSYWNISTKAITDFAFSPDGAYCSIVSEDGCLRVIEMSRERSELFPLC